MKKGKRKHILIIAAIGLVYFIGVAAIVYPMIGNVYTLVMSKDVIRSYNSDIEVMDNSDVEKRLENAVAYNNKLAKGTFDEDLSKSLNLSNNIMCYVEVPSVDIYLPVYYGTSDDVLNKGAGWLEKTSLPVGGKGTHSVIAGHTGLPSAEMFTKLDQTKVGEMFYIRVLDRTLAYRIVSIDAVEPERTDLLHIDKEKDSVTLLTCTPYGINDKRLLVKGERVAYTSDADDGKDSYSDEFTENSKLADEGLQRQISGVMSVIIVITAAAVMIFVGACIWLNVVTKKRSPIAEDKGEKEKSGDDDVKT